MRLTPRSLPQRTLAIAACAAVAASALSLAALPAQAAPASPAVSHAAGTYLVALADGAASPRSVADAVGAHPLATFSSALHGFTAKLSGSQADALAARGDVAALTADTTVTLAEPAASASAATASKPAAAPKSAGSGLKHTAAQAPAGVKHPASVDTGAENGMWGPFGGPTQAGAGVVVGVIGSGISPEAAGLEGDALGTTDDGTIPYLDGHTVVVHKADGTDFHGLCQADGDPANPSWDASTACTTKIVGARYFKTGFDGLSYISLADFPEDYVSPRDALGFGTRAASLAVGNAHTLIPTWDGTTTFSGAAPAADVASYKACWNGGFQIYCTITDIVAAIDQAVADNVDILDMAVPEPASLTPGVIDLALYGAAQQGITVVAPAGDSDSQLGGSSSMYNAPWEITVGASDAQGTALADDGAQRLEGANQPVKPDVLAPGVDTVAATRSVFIGTGWMPAAEVTTSSFNAAADVAGLAALYQAAHPQAGERDIKSALMVTATPLSDGDGEVSPFLQGAGVVNPFTFGQAGFDFNAATPDNPMPGDWADYLDWAGVAAGGNGLDYGWNSYSHPWDVNQPSMVVNGADAPTRLTRWISFATAGTYTISLDGLAGVSLSSDQQATFTVPADQVGVPQPVYVVLDPKGVTQLDTWLFGAVDITSANGARPLRIPAAFRAAGSTVAATASGTGTSGSVALPLTDGAAGAPTVTAYGLTALQHLADDGTAADPDRSGGHLDDHNGGLEAHHWTVEVPEGARVAYFAEQTIPGDGVVGDPAEAIGAQDPVPNVDLLVRHLVTEPDGSVDSDQSWITGYDDRSTAKTLTFRDPEPGQYEIVATASGQDLDFDAWFGALSEGGDGGFTAKINREPGTKQGAPAAVTASWSGLAPHQRYLGAVGYSDGDALSFVTVDSGDGRPMSNTAAPAIAGEAQPGSTLTAQPGGWSVDGTDFAYQWKRDGQPIDGATSATHPVTLDDLGHALSVSVTATKPEYTPATATSAPVSVHPVPVSNTAAPAIAGTPGISQKLTASTGTWSADGLGFAYQWAIDGSPIPGATGASLTVPNQAAGRSVSVTVTASRAGYATATASSASVAIPGVAVRSIVAPKVTGTPTAGSTLHATAGTWSASGLTAAYQWLSGGKPIAGATSAALKLTPALEGKKVAVQVTVSGAGYQGGAATSTTLTVKYAAKLKLTLKPTTSKGVRHLAVTVTVSTKGKASGAVTVTIAGHAHTATLKAGRATVAVGGLRKGIIAVSARWSGSATVVAAKAAAKAKLK